MFPDPPYPWKKDSLRDDWLRNLTKREKHRVGFTTNKRIQARKKKDKRKRMRK